MFFLNVCYLTLLQTAKIMQCLSQKNGLSIGEMTGLGSNPCLPSEVPTTNHLTSGMAVFLKKFQLYMYNS